MVKGINCRGAIGASIGGLAKRRPVNAWLYCEGWYGKIMVNIGFYEYRFQDLLNSVLNSVFHKGFRFARPYRRPRCRSASDDNRKL